MHAEHTIVQHLRRLPCHKLFLRRSIAPRHIQGVQPQERHEVCSSIQLTGGTPTIRTYIRTCYLHDTTKAIYGLKFSLYRRSSLNP